MHKLPLNKSFFLLIFLGLGFSQLNAQDLLTLDEAINLVQENNSEIKRQKIILDASERAVKNSWNSFVPSLTLSATDTFNADKTQNQNEAAINGNVSLSLKADSFSASKKLKLDYEIEKQNYNQLCNQIEVSVWNSYLDIINLQQEIEHRNQILKNSESLVNENELKYKKGYLSETEYLSSKIVFEKQNMEIKNKNQELKNLYSDFKRLVGFDNDSQIFLSSDLESLLVKTNTIFESVSSPSVEILKLQKLAALENLKAKKIAVWSPVLDVAYSAGPTFDERKFNNTVTAGISFSLDSLLPCSIQKEEVRLAEDTLKDLEIQIQNQEKDFSSKFNNLKSELESKKQSIQSYKTFVEITQKNYQLCMKAYNSGRLDYQSLKNASTELLETQIEYTNCVVEIIKTYVSIKELIGGH